MYIAVKSTEIEVANPYYSAGNVNIEPKRIAETVKDYVVFTSTNDVVYYKNQGYTVYTLSEEVDVRQTVTTKIIAKPLI